MVSSRKSKMGLVGCGGIGKWHLKAAAELQEEGLLELAAVCDLVKAKAREMGETYHTPYFADLEKMLRNDLDFIDVCTGDYTHHTVAKLIAEHGKHVLIEKPMAITLPCCDVIIDSCRRAGVYYEVAENYYRTPSERAMKKIIERGIVGDVLRTYAIDPAPANRQSQSPFSSHSPIVRLLDMGSHRMSEIREFAGSEAETIIGVTKPQSPGGMYDDWGHAVVEFENGAIGVCELALGVVGKNNYREVIGTKGTLYNACRWAWGGDIQLTLRGEEGGKPIDVPVEKITRDINGVQALQRIVAKTNPEVVYRNPFADSPFGENDHEFLVGVADEIMSIAKAAVHDEPPEYGIRGRKDIEMCIAMYESSMRRSPVELPIESLTDFEKRVHEAYEETFGQNPTAV